MGSKCVATIHDVRLEIQGVKNKDDIASIRKKIQLDSKINLQINNKKKCCEVIFKSFIYFTVKHDNYKESFNYSDILMGNISIVA